MSVRTACPFCNAWIVNNAIPVVPRTTCTRCGESFKPTTWESTEEMKSFSAQSVTVSKFPKKALLVTTILALIAVGVALAVYQPWATKTMPPIGDPPRTTFTATIPPAALTGLHFLPSSANVILAVQPAALLSMQEPQAKENPRAFLANAGIPDPVLAALERAGIAPEDVEQIVVGLTLAPDRLIPGVTAVLMFHDAVDNGSLLKALHAERKPVAGPPVYTTKLMSLLAKPIDDRTWLFGLTDDDLAAKPIRSLQRFNASIAETLSVRLSPSSFAWIATDNRDWSNAYPLLKTDFKKLAAKLGKGRSIAIALHYENGQRLYLAVDLADATTATEIQEILKAKLPEPKKLMVVDNRIEVDAAIKTEDVGKLLQSIVSDLMK